MLAYFACVPAFTLPDGRVGHVLRSESAVSDLIRDRVAELARVAIAEKGCFSLSIGSGTTVEPLASLAGALDWSCVHLFFGNERTEGEAAGKCWAGAEELIATCGVGHVHRVPAGPAADAAEAYSRTLLDSPAVGTSLYPGSAQVVVSPGCDRACLEAEGKGGVTLSIDAISSARTVLLSAAKPEQAAMVRKCLGWSNAERNTGMPAGMVTCAHGAQVEWLLTDASAVELPAL
mmetsp:Transcript_4823/g.15924  ORF Transcript_4823/g.15924 Transcript_4823/m.15924 type:complete len:233 (+) Transcript_4823:94-792(+)